MKKSAVERFEELTSSDSRHWCPTQARWESRAKEALVGRTIVDVVWTSGRWCLALTDKEGDEREGGIDALGLLVLQSDDEGNGPGSAELIDCGELTCLPRLR